MMVTLLLLMMPPLLPLLMLLAAVDAAADDVDDVEGLFLCGHVFCIFRQDGIELRCKGFVRTRVWQIHSGLS